MTTHTTENLLTSVELKLSEYVENEQSHAALDQGEYRRRRLHLETSLNAAFMRLVDGIISRRIKRDHDPEQNPKFELHWSQRDLRFLRGRFKGLPTDSRARRGAATGASAGGEPDRYQVVEFHELLVELYRVAVRAKDIQHLEEDIARNRRERGAAAERLSELQRTRRRLAPLLVRAEKSREFDALWSQVDTDAVVRHRLNHTRQTRGLTSKKEITGLSSAQDQDRRIRGQIVGLLRNPSTDEERRARLIYDRIAAELEDLHRMQVDLDHAVKNMARRRAQLRERVIECDIEEVLAAVRTELREIFAHSEYAAKMGKTRPALVFTSDSTLLTTDRLLETLARVEEFHPTLFDNMRVRRRGRPMFCIIPGTGMAVSDFANNRVLVPWRTPTTLLESVASGLLMYLRDVTQTQYEPGERLMAAYQKEIKRDFTLKGFVKTHRLLLRDYVKWIQKGAEGLGVFDKSTREWFERYIAPDKYAVKTPMEFRDITLKDINRQVSAITKAGSLGAEECYVLGILNALADRPEIAVEHLRRCMNLDFDDIFPDAAFNLGILHRQMRQYTQARQYFTTYIELAPESWWTRKAQEHLRKLQGLAPGEAPGE